MNNECYQLFATCGHVQTIYGKDDVNMMFTCDPYGDNPYQSADVLLEMTSGTVGDFSNSN